MELAIGKNRQRRVRLTINELGRLAAGSRLPRNLENEPAPETLPTGRVEGTEQFGAVVRELYDRAVAYHSDPANADTTYTEDVAQRMGGPRLRQLAAFSMRYTSALRETPHRRRTPQITAEIAAGEALIKDFATVYRAHLSDASYPGFEVVTVPGEPILDLSFLAAPAPASPATPQVTGVLDAINAVLEGY